MSNRLDERNQLIAKLYDPKSRNGQEIADRFGISRGRINQIYREYSEEGRLMSKSKYNALLPSTRVRTRDFAELRTLAQLDDLPIAHLVRSGIKLVLAKNRDILEEHPDVIEAFMQEMID